MNSNFDSMNIGMKIEIMKLNDHEEVSYPSQVLDIIENNELIISGPIRQNDLVFLHKGEKIKVLYNIKNKGKHYFTAKIVSRNYSSIYTLKIERVSETKNIQQRNYYRLSSTLEVDKEYTINDGDNFQSLNEICESKDISGGGMKLYCNYKHEIEDEILCSFKINNSLIKAKAVVVRVEEIDSFNYKYSLGVSFLELQDESRDIIIRYIFEQQRILRVKGLM